MSSAKWKIDTKNLSPRRSEVLGFASTLSGDIIKRKGGRVDNITLLLYN